MVRFNLQNLSEFAINDLKIQSVIVTTLRIVLQGRLALVPLRIENKEIYFWTTASAH